MSLEDAGSFLRWITLYREFPDDFAHTLTVVLGDFLSLMEYLLCNIKHWNAGACLGCTVATRCWHKGCCKV